MHMVTRGLHGKTPGKCTSGGLVSIERRITISLIVIEELSDLFTIMLLV